VTAFIIQLKRCYASFIIIKGIVFYGVWYAVCGGSWNRAIVQSCNRAIVQSGFRSAELRRFAPGVPCAGRRLPVFHVFLSHFRELRTKKSLFHELHYYFREIYPFFE